MPSCCLLVLERAASEGANSTAIDHARHRLLGARLARTSRRGTGDRAATTRRHRAALLRPCHARWHACDGGRARGLRGFVQPARWRSGPGGGGRAEPGYLWRPVVARRPRGRGQGVVLHVTVKAKNKALLVISELYTQFSYCVVCCCARVRVRLWTHFNILWGARKRARARCGTPGCVCDRGGFAERYWMQGRVACFN